MNVLKKIKKQIALVCVMALTVTSLQVNAFVSKAEETANEVMNETTNEVADIAVQGETTKFAVLSTTDMHGRTWDVNLLNDVSVKDSMLNVATVVKSIRAEYNQNVVLIDNGDTFQGTPVSSYGITSGSLGADGKSPMAIAMKYIGYDAFVLGNHEFNYAWEPMDKIYKYLEQGEGNNVPVLAANLVWAEDKNQNKKDENVFKPYTTKDFTVSGEAFTVGILGLENTDCTRWDVPDNYPNIRFSHSDNPKLDMAKEAERYVTKMKQEGCDFVIVSYHSGLGSGNETGDLTFGSNTENQARRIIKNVSGIDMMITGHDHNSSYSNQSIEGKDGKEVLVVNGGGTSMTKTEVVASLNNQNEVQFAITKPAENVKLTTFAADADLKKQIEPYAEEAKSYVNNKCGKLAEDEWDKKTTSAKCYVEQSDVMDLINRAQIDRGTYYLREKYKEDTSIAVDFSSTSVVLGNFKGLKAGDMTMKDIYTFYKYDNSLYILPLTGAQIKEALEFVASERLTTTITNGQIGFTTKGDYFTCPVFYGLDITYDLGKPKGQKVTIGKFKNGKEFKENQTYNLALNNYHLGNGPFANYTPQDASWSQTDDLGGGSVQDLIKEYLEETTATGGLKRDPSTWKIQYTKDENLLRLPVFETSDIHGFLLDVSSGESSTYQYRMAYIADKVKDTRENGDTLLLDGGDIYQGNPISNLLHGQSMTAAFDSMGYDAVALGNHEFDWGVTTLIDADGTMGSYDLSNKAGAVKGDSKIPVVCGNIYDADTNERVNFTKDYVILEKTAKSINGKTKDMKIAVFGYADDYSADIMAAMIAPYKIDESKLAEMEKLAKKLEKIEDSAKQLEEEGTVDATILLSHAGASAIAGSLETGTAFDLVLGGHTHKDEKGVAKNGVPYLQTKNQARSLGYLELCMDPNTGNISLENAEILPVYESGKESELYDLPENAENLDSEIMKISKIAVEAVAPIMNVPLGTIKEQVIKTAIKNNKFSSTAGTWTAELMNGATGANVSFTNNGGIRTEFKFAEATRMLTAGDIYTIAPFDNPLPTFELTYKELIELIQFAVGTGGASLDLRMGGATAYYDASGQVKTFFVGSKLIYNDGTYQDGYTETDKIVVCTNEYIATSKGTPFASKTSIEASKGENPVIDNVSFMEYLKKEAKANSGALHVNTEATMVSGNWDGVTIPTDYSTIADGDDNDNGYNGPLIYPPTIKPEEPKEPQVPEKSEDVTADVTSKSVIATLRTDGFFYSAVGKKLTNVIVKTESGARYILNKDGEKYVSSIVTIADKNMFIVGDTGEVVTGQIVKTNGARYYTTKASGKVIVGKLFKLSGKKYYADKTGKLTVSKWVTLDGKKCYFNKDGVLAKTKK